jgi:hypothetical protein
VTLSFRLNQDIIDKLRIESEQNNISLNNLTNQILQNYVDWDRLESKAGMIPVAKPVISEAFKDLSDDEVIKLATNVGRDTLNDIILFMRSNINLDSLLSWLELWLKKNSTAGFSHTMQNDIHTCIMKHDLGQKWSLYHKTVLELILDDMLHKHVDIIISNTTLLFQVSKC